MALKVLKWFCSLTIRSNNLTKKKTNSTRRSRTSNKRKCSTRRRSRVLNTKPRAISWVEKMTRKNSNNPNKSILCNVVPSNKNVCIWVNNTRRKMKRGYFLKPSATLLWSKSKNSRICLEIGIMKSKLSKNTLQTSKTSTNTNGHWETLKMIKLNKQKKQQKKQE